MQTTYDRNERRISNRQGICHAHPSIDGLRVFHGNNHPSKSLEIDCISKCHCKQMSFETFENNDKEKMQTLEGEDVIVDANNLIGSFPNHLIGKENKNYDFSLDQVSENLARSIHEETHDRCEVYDSFSHEDHDYLEKSMMIGKEINDVEYNEENLDEILNDIGGLF